MKTYLVTIDGHNVPVIINAKSAFAALDKVLETMQQHQDTPKITVRLCETS